MGPQYYQYLTVMCLTLLNDVIIIIFVVVIIIMNINIITPLFYKYWFLIELINRILYSGTSPLGHLCPFGGHKIWKRTNILIIFWSVTSVERTPLFRGRGHFSWVPNPRFNLHAFRGHLSTQNVTDHNDYSFHNMNNITALVGTTRQQFTSEKLTVIFYFAASKWYLQQIPRQKLKKSFVG